MAAMRLVMAASILLLAECRSMVRREATPKVQLDEDGAEPLAADFERAAALQAPDLEPFDSSFDEDGVGGGDEANLVSRAGKGGNRAGKHGSRKGKHGKNRSGKGGHAARRRGKTGQGKSGKSGSRKGKNGSKCKGEGKGKGGCRHKKKTTASNATVTTGSNATATAASNATEPKKFAVVVVPMDEPTGSTTSTEHNSTVTTTTTGSSGATTTSRGALQTTTTTVKATTTVNTTTTPAVTATTTVDPKKFCCEKPNAECLACVAGMTVVEFCSRFNATPGCITKTVSWSLEQPKELEAED